MEFGVLLEIFFKAKAGSVPQNKEKLDEYYGISAPSISMVENCLIQVVVAAQPWGTPNVLDAPLELLHQKIHEMLLAHSRMNLCEIMKVIGLSLDWVFSILTNYFGIGNLSAKWVRRLLTIDYKRSHVPISEECLALCNRNPDKILRSFIIVDETRIHYNTPENKH